MGIELRSFRLIYPLTWMLLWSSYIPKWNKYPAKNNGASNLQTISLITQKADSHLQQTKLPWKPFGQKFSAKRQSAKTIYYLAKKTFRENLFGQKSFGEQLLGQNNFAKTILPTEILPQALRLKAFLQKLIRPTAIRPRLIRPVYRLRFQTPTILLRRRFSLKSSNHILSNGSQMPPTVQAVSHTPAVIIFKDLINQQKCIYLEAT